MCWLYKNKDWYKEKWRIEKGGGPLGINLVHDIDLICYLLGPITHVQATTSNKIRKYIVEDTAIVNFTFRSGALCTLSVSDTIVAPYSYELTAGENPAYPITNQSAYFIGGTKGSIQFPNLKHWYNKGERSWWKPIYHKDFNIRLSRFTLINQINHLCDVVSGKAKPKVSGNDGLQSLKIFDAILRSTKTGKKNKSKLVKRLKLGIIGGGPGSWIGHVHRIASRFDDKYEIVAGVFSRNYKINQSFGTSIGIKKNRCYKNYKDLCYFEKKN